MSENESKASAWLDYIFKLSVVLALLVTGVILASDIVIPLAFAGLLAVVMLPVIRFLENKGLGTILSISLVFVSTVGLLTLVLWLTIHQASLLLNDLPNLEAKSTAFISNVQRTLSDDFGMNSSRQKELLGELMKSVSGYLGNLLLDTTNTLSTLLQIPVYVFLFLIYREKFHTFIHKLIPGNGEHRWKREAENVLQGYISGMFLVTLIVSFLNSLGLWIVGIDHPIFFGILSGVLTIIPYVGIIIGSLFPIAMALITRDSLWYTAGVVIVFTIVQFLEGNFITPRITGSKVSINALAAIVALLIGGKILGIAGMILSIPAIGMLKIVLSYSQRLSPFVILLDDRDEDRPIIKDPPKATMPVPTEQEPEETIVSQ